MSFQHLDGHARSRSRSCSPRGWRSYRKENYHCILQKTDGWMDGQNLKVTRPKCIVLQTHPSFVHMEILDWVVLPCYASMKERHNEPTEQTYPVITQKKPRAAFS